MQSSQPTSQSAADLAVCRSILSQGSKSFSAASLLLPRRVRDPATATYAFCRIADDAVDDNTHPRRGLDELRQRLDTIYTGSIDLSSTDPQRAVDRAFARAIDEFEIPRDIPEALFQGFEWDIDGRTYSDLCSVVAYSARVASSVGVMMTLIMRQRGVEALARACDLGVAMQLTNIARDVGDDARAGRLYLPLDWLADEQIDGDAFVRAPTFSAGLGRVIERLLKAADHLYERALDGIALLPRDCRPAIDAARRIYAEIGAEIRRNGLDSVSRRAVVPTWRKLVLIGQSIRAVATRPTNDPMPPLDEVSFLVDL